MDGFWSWKHTHTQSMNCQTRFYWWSGYSVNESWSTLVNGRSGFRSVGQRGVLPITWDYFNSLSGKWREGKPWLISFHWLDYLLTAELPFFSRILCPSTVSLISWNTHTKVIKRHWIHFYFSVFGLVWNVSLSYLRNVRCWFNTQDTFIFYWK